MSRVDPNTFSPKSASTTEQTVLPHLKRGAEIVVIGAGAFGSWASLYLLRKGFKVTMVDAWGPGNSRSSSGDETRVIRSTYGANELYFDLNVKALSLWKENEKAFGRQLFYNTGVLWLCYQEKTPLVDDSIPFAKRNQMEYEYLTQEDLKKEFPLVHADDLHHAYFDPFGGYLKARESVQMVVEAFLKEGGTYNQSYVLPGRIHGNDLSCILLSNGDRVTADGYIFACGSWLNRLFPDVLGDFITCTKQEVYYFGVPPEHSNAFDDLPVWVDVDGKDFYYGIPGNANRGFKLGVDIRGEVFDPTLGERTITSQTLKRGRQFLAHRFPLLKNSPVLESRVCPYENSPDGNFVFDLLPGTVNAFVLGGGSGHGFKHGPALGQLIADVLLGEGTVPPLFSLKSRRGV